MTISQKKAIIVLGPPRSGTSAISHLIYKFGVNFGNPDNFIDSQQHKHNPIFFELKELNKINDDIFSYFGKSWGAFDWMPTQSDFTESIISKFEHQIRKFISDEFDDKFNIGLKDPRFCFTLPIWASVLKRLGYDLNLVICKRNPNSVFTSNTLVNGSSSSINFRLVINSTLSMLNFAKNLKSITVVYEELIENPHKIALNLSTELKLSVDDLSQVYSVIDQKLNHNTKYQEPFFETFKYLNDLELKLEKNYKIYKDFEFAITNDSKKEYIKLISELHDLDNKIININKVALEENSITSTIQKTLVDTESTLKNQQLISAEKDNQITSLNQTLKAKEELVLQLVQTVAEKDNQLNSLKQALTVKEESVLQLVQTVAERDNQFNSLKQALTVKEETVSRLEQAVINIHNQNSICNQVINEKNAQIADMLALMERDAEIVRLSEAVTEREGEIARLSSSVEALRNSKSWRYTALIRNIASLTQPTTRLVKSVRHAALESGGYLNLTEKVIAVAKREGLSGVNNRIAHVVEQHVPVATENGEPAHRNDYQTWIKQYDTLDDQAIEKIQLEIASFDRKPKISVVMPVYNAPLNFLEEAIRSVQNQIYDHWELCIADDASTDKSIRPLLERYAKEDPRIKVVFRSENGHISAASNSALSLASGDFVALLDNDDLLPVHALYHVAKTIIKNPNVALIYSDEDKIDEKGERVGPYFKTNWNPDLFYSHNMFCHLGVYKRSLLENIGGFQLGLEGSQDYDLTLRCIEKINANQIIHLPYILYHWRVHPASTAMSSDAKPYAMIAGERAINQHFQRTGVKGHVKLIGHGYNPHYDLPATHPLVSIIIPTRNAHGLVSQCINSIRKLSTYPSYEILLIDNGSDDPASLGEWDRMARDGVRVLRDDSPFNYSALNNMAVKKAKGEVLILLNNDTEVIEPRWLEIMVAHAVRPGIGPVGAKLLYPDDTIQHAGVVLGLGGLAGAAGHAHYKFPGSSHGYCGRISLTSNFSAVTGACIAVRRDLYLKVNGLDEENLRIAFNDVDFCLKLGELGYRCVYAPDAVLYHHESASRGAEDNPEKKARFKQETDWMRARWGSLIDNDPYYSPNLTLEHADFSLAWPPRTRSTQP